MRHLIGWRRVGGKRVARSLVYVSADWAGKAFGNFAINALHDFRQAVVAFVRTICVRIPNLS